jgi:glycosyltransferase involved in cell wall biosynthesis
VRHRVVVLNHFAAPRSAPGGTRHVELFGRLQGWDATVLGSRINYFTRSSARLDDHLYRTVPVLPYKGNGAARVLNWVSYAFTAFTAALRLPRPDVVYASSPHLFAGLAGWLLAKVRGAHFVLEIRDLWPAVLVDMKQLDEGSSIYRLLKTMERFLYRQADAVIVMAEGVRRVVTEEEGVPGNRVYLIPNGADPDDFAPPLCRDDLRRRYGLRGQVFAYTGAHGPANGLELMLDAASAVADSIPDACFLLVGDGVTKEALIDRATRERLSNVSFMPPVPKDEMPALLGAVDFGLHILADIPLFSYGVSPNKLFDYMAAGLPVLTNTGGEVAQIVQTADAGIAVEANHMAEGIQRLAASSKEQRATWGGNGREFIAANRSRTALAHQLEAMLNSLVTIPDA